MIHTANTVRTLQAIAILVGTSVFLWSIGVPALFRSAEAASIIDASDTLSNSAPSMASNHTLAFTTPNGMAIGETIELTFPAQFTLGGLDEDDVDIDVNASPAATAASAGAGVWGVSTSTNTITFTTPTDSGLASSTDIVIRIGLNAVNSGTGDTQIINPAATTSYAIQIGGSMPDMGEVRVAIVDQVTVSASIEATLTFTVSGVNAGQVVNGSPTTTVATTTSATLPFGTLTVGQSRTLAQDLAVTTNATNGFTVTVEQTGDLQSTTGATIDGFIDGTYTTTPSPWQEPAGLVVNPDTYGHWGLTTDDDDIPARAVQFGSDEWVSGSTTPIAIMGHDGPSVGGNTRIGYQIEISPLQEAGDDYTTTLRYIATPTF
jgi:hypothetical protein